jgi:hypothetical protein
MFARFISHNFLITHQKAFSSSTDVSSFEISPRCGGGLELIGFYGKIAQDKIHK